MVILRGARRAAEGSEESPKILPANRQKAALSEEREGSSEALGRGLRRAPPQTAMRTRRLWM